MNYNLMALVIVFLAICGLIFWIKRHKNLPTNAAQQKILFIAKIVTTILIIAQFFLTIHLAPKPSPSLENAMSEDEIDNVKTSFAKCWDISEKDSSLPIVKIYVLVNPDTSIQTLHVIDAEKERYVNDPVYKKAADLAMNDLKACSPLTFLPKGKYEIWKDLTLTFNPKSN